MELSTIITAFDKHDLTLAHIKASMDVSRVPDEIIVVNDHGDPSLKDMIKDIKDKKCPIVYSYVLDDIEWNYNGACNLAVFLASGKYLAFEDNDNFPSFTFYEEALKRLKKDTNITRVQATKRKVVSLEDLLEKPRDEWEVIGQEGPNMGTAMIPRKYFANLKGHDERFCGQYGMMYIDYRSRAMGMYGKENYSASEGEYFYTKDGQSDLSRTTHNRSYYLDNAHRIRDGGSAQHPGGIINFRYETTYLPRD